MLDFELKVIETSPKRYVIKLVKKNQDGSVITPFLTNLSRHDTPSQPNNKTWKTPADLHADVVSRYMVLLAMFTLQCNGKYTVMWKDVDSTQMVSTEISFTRGLDIVHFAMPSKSISAANRVPKPVAYTRHRIEQLLKDELRRRFVNCIITTSSTPYYAEE